MLKNSDLAFQLPLPGGAEVKVGVPTKVALMNKIITRLAEGEGFALATLNLDHVVKLRQPGPFREAYALQDMVVADGNPIVWLSRLANRPVELVPGSELIDPLCELAAANGWPVAFLGSTEKTLVTAGAELSRRYLGLEIAAQVAPPFGLDPEGEEAADLLRQIQVSGARLCFLALGAPKQEILAMRARAMAPACGFVSIGAGLDFIAGTQARAPAWVRAIAMEWFWRMVGNPKRLARRYILCALILPGLAWRVWRARGPASPS